MWLLDELIGLPDIYPSAPAKSFQARPDLGPNQISWCEQHIPNFKLARAGVLAVQADQDANRKAMGA